MVLPILMGALRGASLLGRGVMMGSRFLVRGLGSAARWAVKGIRSFVTKAIKGGKSLLPKMAKGLNSSVRKVVSNTSGSLKRLMSSSRRTSPKKALPKGASAKAVREFEKFFAEHPSRVEAVKNYTLRQMSEHVMKDVQSRIPSQYKELSNSLRVEALPGKNPVYTVRVVAKKRSLKRNEGTSSVLYVSPKKRILRRTSAAIKVLEDFGPWTSDTLPFMPSSKEATVVRRQESKGSVKKLKKEINAKKNEWTARLAEAGVKVEKKLQPKEIKVVSDLSHQSVSLEFGLGVRSSPHWRPAILWAKNAGPAEILSSDPIGSALFDPKFKGWKKWRQVSNVTTTKVVKGLVPFQKKMGIGL